MKQFENVRNVQSPSDFLSTSETAQSSIFRTSTTFSTFTNSYETKAPRILRKLHNDPISQSHVGFSEHHFDPRASMTGSQMMQSHVWHTKKEICHLSQARLAEISRKFLKDYGAGNEIRKDGVKNIQKQARNNFCTFQQNQQSIEGLFQVMDENRDKRISYEDVYSLGKRYLSFEKKQINYTKAVEEKLTVARRLFKLFDIEKMGYLTEKQVPYLLKETYKSLGKDFNPTSEDIKSWMKLTNADNSGRVFLPEYERSIIRALKKQAVQIYDD